MLYLKHFDILEFSAAIFKYIPLSLRVSVLLPYATICLTAHLDILYMSGYRNPRIEFHNLVVYKRRKIPLLSGSVIRYLSLLMYLLSSTYLALVTIKSSLT